MYIMLETRYLEKCFTILKHPNIPRLIQVKCLALMRQIVERDKIRHILEVLVLVDSPSNNLDKITENKRNLI